MNLNELDSWHCVYEMDDWEVIEDVRLLVVYVTRRLEKDLDKVENSVVERTDSFEIAIWLAKSHLETLSSVLTLMTPVQASEAEQGVKL